MNVEGHVFISHASVDDDFVAELRQKLEAHGITVWVDSRRLRGGDKLDETIAEAIETASHVIVVLSPETQNSTWVKKEIDCALATQAKKKAAGQAYQVIPLLLPGVEPSALGLWFEHEPVAVSAALEVGGVADAMPRILAALGERSIEDSSPPVDVSLAPVAELVLELTEPTFVERDKVSRAQARAVLKFQPETTEIREVVSDPFLFTAPLGPIEADNLRWYLERYAQWPWGQFRERAASTEKSLPSWGEALYAESLGQEAAQEALYAWRSRANGTERRLSVYVNRKLMAGTDKTEQASADEAAGTLLGLPWELLHSTGAQKEYLFRGKEGVRVRRRLPNRADQSGARPTAPPIRILVISPRPEDDRTAYIDHRVSARPLVEAVETLGELVALTFLSPPTYPALDEALRKAERAKKPFDVIHFDGHGVFDHTHGLGALCFEDPKSAHLLSKRAMDLIHADKLRALVKGHRVPLVFLEACQGAMAEESPTASVAAALLQGGTTSVVAMSHSVLVETARRFVEAFYRSLAQGDRVGSAMLEGQRTLANETFRLTVPGAGDLHLEDWFVPVLFQEAQDPPLINKLPSERVQALEATRRALSLGALPDPPSHHFVGRSRELLELERLLETDRYATVLGTGGLGKTTLAVELARWLVRTRRFERAAFVSLETYDDTRGVLDSLGQQLLPEGKNWSVADFPGGIDEARQHVDRALRDQATLIVFDNLESALPEGDQAPSEEVSTFLQMCTALLAADARSRLVFTSRESLPEPFDAARGTIRLGPLSEPDAITLVREVMTEQGHPPPENDAGHTPEEITALVESVGRHARALVLLAREVSRRGVMATTETVTAIMADLQARYPDDRERSLYASVRLSFERLSPEHQRLARGLALFRGGANFAILSMFLEIEPDAARELCGALIDVGLGQDRDYGFVELDPALPSYLATLLDAEERSALEGQWLAVMRNYISFLYHQHGTETQLAATLTRLELPNLLAFLEALQSTGTPEDVAQSATSLEYLVSFLGRSSTLKRIVAVRERAAAQLGDWSRAQFEALRADIERRFDAGDVRGAHDQAQALLERALAAGETAYPGANYDLAVAHLQLGRVLRVGGAAEAALEVLAEAEQRFQPLAEAGDPAADVMFSVSQTELADCLGALGKLDQAAALYDTILVRDEPAGRERNVAVVKGQLATTRGRQQRFDEALTLYREVREIFEQLGEPRSVAVIWHQIGIVHQGAGRYEAAEDAYRKSLALRVREGDTDGEADSLIAIGNVYAQMGRQEEAVTFYRQATDRHVELGNLAREGMALSNLAHTLVALSRLDEAREALDRAIVCKQSIGLTAEPWRAWDILHKLEQAAGQPAAALAAYEQAVASYLEYRQAGGENQNPGGRLCASVAQAVEEGNTEEIEALLGHQLDDESPDWLRTLLPKLQAIVAGERDPGLARDTALGYTDAVELRLLLKRLSS